jgi:hypothetical protein
MKRFGLVGWCAIVALLLGFSAVNGWADERSQTPAVAESVTNSSPTMCRCTGGATAAATKIVQTLAEPLKSTGLEFTEEPLENVVNFLQNEYDIPIFLDIHALEDDGLTPDEAISINVRNISLRSAMRMLLKQKNLTYVIRNEVLIITTPEEAEANLVACVYDVRDLIDGNHDNRDIKSLADVVVSCIAPETWAVNKGGEAKIRTLRPGLLVISQTQAVHEQIADLLSVIRETLGQPIRPPEDEARGMRGGRGDEGSGGKGMEGGRSDEMGAEPTPAEATPSE